MPFIKQDRRDDMLNGNLKSPEVGDLCYKHYHRMVTLWKANRRWTTAHYIYKALQKRIIHKQRIIDDNTIAYQLAWQVFFQLHVMPYELEKREANGDI